jgi:hypothetical protein
MEDIAPKLAVPGGAERVAAILQEPKVVLLRERGEHVEIGGDADGVRDENGARFRADGGLDLLDVDVVAARLAIDEDGDEAILHQRRERGRERDGWGDDFVAGAQAILDLRAEQRGDHEQVRRRAGVDQVRRLRAEIVAHLPLELVGEWPCRQPELQHAVHAQAQFLVIIDAARIRNLRLTRNERLPRMRDGVVPRHQIHDLITDRGSFRCAHSSSSPDPGRVPLQMPRFDVRTNSTSCAISAR